MDPDDASRHVRHYCSQHDALRVFLSKREPGPGLGENLLNVVPYGHVKTLHVGQGRAATIYDEVADVCWLLAYGDTHATGEKRDVYRHFEKLSERGELLPTTKDYEALKAVTPAGVIDALRELASDVYTRAQGDLGHEVLQSITLDDERDASITISIEILVMGDDRMEQGWVSFVIPHEDPVDEDMLLGLIADLIPAHVDVDTIDYAGDVNGRPVRYDELAFTWSYSSS